MTTAEPEDAEKQDAERFDAAAAWWARLDAGALPRSELEAFRAWLAADPRNEAAFEEACDLWGDWERAPKALASAYVAALSPAPRRRRLRPVAALAALGLALFLGFDPLWLWLRADARTGTGELRSIALPDGSRAHLGAGSAIALHYGGDRRRVALLAGEALFEVEPDPSRPFVVEAAGGEILARGTAFDVSTNESRTEVTVTEHAVEVTGAGAPIRVEAGRQTAYGPGLPALDAYAVDPDRVTAWRRGRLYFNDKPLGEVIAALARYYRGYVLVAGSALRDRRVTGVFRTDQPLEALRAIEKSLGLKSTRLSDYLILLHS
ncbi:MULTISPECIES: FecR family protein [Methylosinus]|uniref:Iron dicitrate transport regulator FecR n=1 Tax=Methylosinus trichosporium (strain ATCC 35070 / NCIMB 11131 / UNIQEM 75 / OB3b) TaxID=595536 RepID=A0A2D2CX71_METT3|nr:MULTISPECIES: FecR family protein [Methylosinus]ATQ67342.1 iron dicitrate transport regulator FecR [Methylosinus trichosporium OB3b]OBS51644.1 iron dicitrate transport regulator FecR [Methylosinus sp. 3S-1]